VEQPLIDLLDDRRLDGDVDVECLLGPTIGAVLLDRADFAAAIRTIESLCENWGGACTRLYPVDRETDALPEDLFNDFSSGDVHAVAGADVLAPAFEREGQRDLFLVDRPGTIGTSLLSVLLATSHLSDVRVTVTDVDPSDPWSLSYAVALGTLRDESFTEHELRSHRLRPGASWNDLIDIRREPAAPSATDLLSRLRENRRITPVRLSRTMLDLYISGRNQGIGGDESPLPRLHVTKQLVGPNLVVMYEPGSVEDLALLWNLRAPRMDSLLASHSLSLLP
jgi:hypothetical protein